jgi:transcriptional regulator with XRE-family HTH domain
VTGRLGVSRQTVGKWESGKAVPELEKLVALCDLLDYSPDELVGRSACASGRICDAVAAEDGEVNSDDASEVSIPIRVGDISQRDVFVLARNSGLFAMGAWVALAAVGLSLLLCGPLSVDDVEAHRVVPYVITLGAFLGVGLAAAATLLERRAPLQVGIDMTSVRKWRLAAVAAAFVIAIASCFLFAFMPDSRVIMMVLVEVSILAAWPAAFALFLTRVMRG